MGGGDKVSDPSSRPLIATGLLVLLASDVLLSLRYTVAHDVAYSPDICAICAWAEAFVATAMAPSTVFVALLIQVVGTRSPLSRRTFVVLSSQPRSPPLVHANGVLLDRPVGSTHHRALT